MLYIYIYFVLLLFIYLFILLVVIKWSCCNWHNWKKQACIKGKTLKMYSIKTWWLFNTFTYTDDEPGMCILYIWNS